MRSETASAPSKRQTVVYVAQGLVQAEAAKPVWLLRLICEFHHRGLLRNIEFIGQIRLRLNGKVFDGSPCLQAFQFHVAEPLLDANRAGVGFWTATSRPS